MDVTLPTDSSAAPTLPPAPAEPQLDPMGAGATQTPPQLPPAPQAPTQAPAPQQPFWKQLLRGAMAGIAGSAGATSFGGGVAGGAAGELHQQQQDFSNQQQVRFANLQDAKQAADLTRQMTEEQHWNDETKSRNDQLALAKAQFFRAAGYKVTPLQRSPDAVTTFLKTNGGKVDPYTFNDSNTIYAVTPGEDKGWRASSSLAAAIGAHEATQEEYNQLTPAGRASYDKSVNDQLSKMSPKQIDTAIAQYSTNPNADPNIIGLLQKQRDLAQAGVDDKDTAKDKQMQRQIKVGAASAYTRNATRFMPYIDKGGMIQLDTAQNIAKGGYTPLNGTAMKAAGNTAQIQDISKGIDALEKTLGTVGEVDPTTAATVTKALQQSNGMVTAAVQTEIKKSLTPDQQRVAANLLMMHERVMAVRGLISAGAGSDEQRRAIQATVPEVTDPLPLRQQKFTDLRQMMATIQGGTPRVANMNNSAPQPQHTPGGQASGLQEGATGTGSNGQKYVVKGGVWVPLQSR